MNGLLRCLKKAPQLKWGAAEGSSRAIGVACVGVGQLELHALVKVSCAEAGAQMSVMQVATGV